MLQPMPPCAARSPNAEAQPWRKASPQNLRRSHAAHHSRACLGCNPRGETAVEQAIFTLASVRKPSPKVPARPGSPRCFPIRNAFRGAVLGFSRAERTSNSRVLASIIMRGLERESKIVSLRITISDRPGMLGEIASEIGALRREHSGGVSSPLLSRRAGEGDARRYRDRNQDRAHAMRPLAS